MGPVNAKELLRKYADGTCTHAERDLFEQWYSSLNQTDRVHLTEAELQLAEQAIQQKLLIAIQAPKRIILWPRIAAAAAILVFIAAGLYFYQYKIHHSPFTAHYYANDIAPGNNQATLILANGQKIMLTKNLHGQLAEQQGTRINAAGAITYTAGANAKTEYNTLTTKRGEQSPFPLILADGTKIWLNAESSVTFPTAFNSNSREIKFTGEGVFEVAHDAKKPFRIICNGQIVEDLGTQFDLNAYADEPLMKTTLLEGSVKVTKPGHQVILKPGQQAINSQAGIRVADANIEEVFAWKNGKFRFHDQSIQETMRQIARWYNVDIKYEGDGITTDGLNGKISRDKNISQVLQMLETTKLVHFKVKGKEVTVTR